MMLHLPLSVVSPLCLAQQKLVCIHLRLFNSTKWISIQFILHIPLPNWSVKFGIRNSSYMSEEYDEVHLESKPNYTKIHWPQKNGHHCCFFWAATPCRMKTRYVYSNKVKILFWIPKIKTGTTWPQTEGDSTFHFTPKVPFSWWSVSLYMPTGGMKKWWRDSNKPMYFLTPCTFQKHPAF